jgi:hypothetical protein
MSYKKDYYKKEEWHTTQTVVEDGIKYRVKTFTKGEYVGDQFWYLKGKYHRVRGPAISLNHGYKTWYQNDKYHRLDGPALIAPRSNEFEWHIKGKQFTKDQHAKIRIMLALSLANI